MNADGPLPVRAHRSLPSWLISLCIHVAILIFLAWVIRPPRASGLPGPDRTVGIALAQAGEESIEYLDRVDSATDAASSLSEASATTPPTKLPDTAALSQLDSAPVTLPEVGMPTLPVEGVLSELGHVAGGPTRLPSGVDTGKILAEDASLRRRRVAQGPSTQVSLFGGGAAEGRSFIFVIDRSQSMGRDGLGVLALATDEFQRALAALQSVHQFQIVAYNHDRVFFGTDDKLMPATDANKQQVGKFMRGLAAFGATVHFSAIMSALNRAPDVVFLLTDGDPSLSDAQLAQIRRRAAGRTTIHCIQFSSRPWDGEDNFMQRLRARTVAATAISMSHICPHGDVYFGCH